MLKGIDLNDRCHWESHDHAHPTILVPPPAPTFDDFYSSDEFRMYAYKIKRCPRTHSHDWTECPYAHHGEKAQRRDPRKYNYCAVACPAFRNGSCQKGDACEQAHGVFEYWLHPARYRTRACNAGRFCQRKVCFFAHSMEELRAETKYKSNCVYRARTPRDNAPVSLFERASLSTMTPRSEESMDGVSEYMRRLSVSGEEEEEGGNGSGGGLEWDLPHLGWITDLVD
ncbi:hypothetical protein MLD38_019818 [Melastoma candidum]|uniref:Uncharacterized protein n=1 Tax=Melastoma candidum TaxID=119954 RepID=A0ACB9QBA0_9MYRT|nr:hypothetical protein MLD38_019818 [Melastoma candidum]